MMFHYHADVTTTCSNELLLVIAQLNDEAIRLFQNGQRNHARKTLVQAISLLKNDVVAQSQNESISVCGRRNEQADQVANHFQKVQGDGLSSSSTITTNTIPTTTDENKKLLVEISEDGTNQQDQALIYYSKVFRCCYNIIGNNDINVQSSNNNETLLLHSISMILLYNMAMFFHIDATTQNNNNNKRNNYYQKAKSFYEMVVNMIYFDEDLVRSSITLSLIGLTCLQNLIHCNVIGLSNNNDTFQYFNKFTTLLQSLLLKDNEEQYNNCLKFSSSVNQDMEYFYSVLFLMELHFKICNVAPGA